MTEILRAIYVAQRDIQAYIALTEQTELEPGDCLAIARMFVPRRSNETLAWVECGRALDHERQFRSTAAYDLDRFQDFRKHPSKFTYDDLMKFMPNTERAPWHEKALNAASGANLHSLLELFTETKETERLPDLVRGSSDELSKT